MFGWLVSDDITQWQLFWYVMQIHLQITCATNYFSSSKVNDTPCTTMSFHHATSGYHATKACTYTSGYLIYRTKKLLSKSSDLKSRSCRSFWFWFATADTATVLKVTITTKLFFYENDTPSTTISFHHAMQSVGNRQQNHVPVGTSYVEREKPTYISTY